MPRITLETIISLVMRLRRIEWLGYRVPFRRRFVSAGSDAGARHGLLLKLHADSGIAGIGEPSPVGAGDERSVREIADRLRSAAPLLLGADISDMAALRSVGGSLAGALAPLRFGVQAGLLDLLGKSLRRPIAALLGGSPRPLRVNALLSAEESSAAAAEAGEAVAAGFTTVKLKIGYSSIESDLRRLGAVRAAVGPAVSIRADANQAWTVAEAIENIGRLEPLKLEYVEQPVPAGDMAGLAAVRRAVSTPVAADEALASIEDARRVIEMKAAGFLIVKAARCGVLESLEIMRLAGWADLPAVITSSLETDIGIAASLHLAAAVAPGELACGLATGALLESGLACDPLAHARGMLVCPDGPGLGVSIDEAAMALYSTGVRGSVPA